MSVLNFLFVSIVGMLCGFAAGTIVLVVSLWHPWAGLAASWQEIWGMLLVQIIVAAPLSILGWAGFLVPVVLLQRRAATASAGERMIILGACIGAAMVTVVYTVLFHGIPHALLLSIPYELSGAVNAATGSAVSLSLTKAMKKSPARSSAENG